MQRNLSHDVFLMYACFMGNITSMNGLWDFRKTFFSLLLTRSLALEHSLSALSLSDHQMSRADGVIINGIFPLD